MSNDPHKGNRLDMVEQRLYSPKRDVEIKSRKPLKEKEYDIPQDWEYQNSPEPEIELPEDGPNWFFRFFIVAFIFFLGAAGYAGYVFFLAPQSITKNIDILVNAPLSVGAGEEFNFEVMIENKDASPIILAELEIQFPDGTRRVDDINTLYKNDKQSIERVEGGTVVKKNYSALLFGQENEKKDIKVFLTYRTEDSTAFFEKEKTIDTILKTTPVRVSVTNITETTSGQNVDFKIELVSNSTQTLRDIVVEASFPFGFIFKNSNIPLESDKKSWIIPVLEPKEAFTLNVSGTLDGQQGDEKFFRFITGLKIPDSAEPFVAFNSKDILINIKRPFLEVDFDINQKTDAIVALDPEINNNAKITFKNNTQFPIRNTEISLFIKGDALRKNSVQVNQGFYQSLTNTILWDNSTVAKLSSVPVGGSETVSFSFSGLGLANQSFITNPELTFAVQVKGNRNPENNVIDTLEDTVTRTIRFNTETSIETKSEHFSSIFTNTGPIPPKVETRTSYTGVVQVLNTSNAVEGAVVSMKVPNYVTYEGVYSPTEENVAYDPVTRTITWNIGTLAPKTGYQGIAPKRLYIQTSLVPSVSQSGQSPEILNAIVFEGTDSFTGTSVKKNVRSITTVISDAKNYGDGQVSR